MKKYIFLLLFSISWFACEESLAVKQRKIQDTKWEAMMANHDVVMPMMGNTFKVRKSLKKLLEGSENLPEETVAKANELIENLQKADDEMMTWMNVNGGQKLKKIQKKMDHDTILQYIDKQDIAIKKIGKTMTDNIQNGLNFLENLSQ